MKKLKSFVRDTLIMDKALTVKELIKELSKHKGSLVVVYDASVPIFKEEIKEIKEKDSYYIGNVDVLELNH